MIQDLFLHKPQYYRYCPGGPDSDFEYSTQSYTGYEVSTDLSLFKNKQVRHF